MAVEWCINFNFDLLGNNSPYRQNSYLDASVL